MRSNSYQRVHVLSLGVIALVASPVALADERSQALRLFDRLAGIPLKQSDPRLAQMTSLIASGNVRGAAAIATAADGFYNITVKHFATPLSNRAEDPQEGLNDFIATVVGVTRDQIDARQLLTGNFVYQGNPATVQGMDALGQSVQSNRSLLANNRHYDRMEEWRTNLRQHLVSVPQRGYVDSPDIVDDQGAVIGQATPITLPDTAGLLTSQQWARAHLNMGTNRRAIEYAFKQFLCVPNTATRDTTVSDDRVRQDVSRAPGGNPTTYQTSCRGCHAPGDALTGAYAFFNDGSGMDSFVQYTVGSVQQKMLINGDVAPDGFITTDDSWISRYNRNQNVALGWDASIAQQGNGIGGVGRMLAGAQAFASCMAKRVFRQVCRREPEASEATFLQTLTQEFIAGGYRLKGLFEAAAVHPRCLGN